MRYQISRRGLLLAFLTLTTNGTAEADKILVVQGSTTFNTRLIVPFLADIETRAGVKLDVIPTKSAFGLEALLDGRVTLAMISGPLDQELGPLRIRHAQASLDELRTFEIARTGVALVAHPQNPVKSASLDQITAVLDGKIVSWRALGGPDLPVRPVFVRDGGVIGSAQSQLLSGHALRAPHALPVETPRHVLKVLMQEPGALAIAQSALVAQLNLTPLTTDRDIAQILAIVTRGKPTAASMRLIDAMRAVASERLR